MIAEAVLDLPAETLARLPRLGLADSALKAPAAGFGEVEAYVDFGTKVAVLGWHLVKNQPLPDGNKRAAFSRCGSSPSATVVSGRARRETRGN